MNLAPKVEYQVNHGSTHMAGLYCNLKIPFQINRNLFSVIAIISIYRGLVLAC